MLSNRALMARSRQQPLEHRMLLTATFCLLAGGAVMVYSASSARTLLGATATARRTSSSTWSTARSGSC